MNPLKFYAFANGAFYFSTDGGLTFAATAASNLPPAGASAQFKATPGREGDIWLAGGSATTVYGIWHSINGGNTFYKLWDVDAASTIGFGKPAPFHKYPALYSSAEVAGPGASIAPTMPDSAGRGSATNSTSTHSPTGHHRRSAHLWARLFRDQRAGNYLRGSNRQQSLMQEPAADSRGLQKMEARGNRRYTVTQIHRFCDSGVSKLLLPTTLRPAARILCGTGTVMP